jgi:membrane-associated phospholipid phosphatase
MVCNKILWTLLGWWLAALAAIAVCIRWIDHPVAAVFLRLPTHADVVGRLFSGNVIAACELIFVSALAIVRLWTGRLSKLAKVVFVACCTSLMAYALNGTILKVIFGRPNPIESFQTTSVASFNLFQGDEFSSFPSGHMTLAAAFLAVIFRVYPRTRRASLSLLLLGGSVLVAGDWHFVSDVIAGAIFGVTCGLLAAELWISHTNKHQG